MSDEIKIALIGVVSAVASLMVSWMLGRLTKMLDARAAKKGKMPPEYIQLKAELEELRKQFADEREAQRAADRVILEDRIRFIGRGYIHQGYIFAEDKELLMRMWEVYHNQLGGNGYLQTVMDGVNSIEVRYK